MEKRDLLIVVAALAIVVVMALFVKPMLTGEPANLELPSFGGAEGEPEGKQIVYQTSAYTMPPTEVTTPPTTIPAWEGESKKLGFVAPASAMPTPTHMFPPEITAVPEKLLTYVTIQGKAGGTTESFEIPFPYWELWYTVDPWETRYVGETSSKEAGVADVLAVEVFPSFSIELRDASDNSLVKTIEPRGGLDPDLWDKGEEYDPRPWIEKFYEGGSARDYYFVINTHMIRSYKIEVKVPDRYIGQY
jgi:hypothetical protein